MCLKLNVSSYYINIYQQKKYFLYPIKEELVLQMAIIYITVLTCESHFHAQVFTTMCIFFYHQYLGFVGCFGTFGGAILLLSIQSLILVPNFGEHIPIAILTCEFGK